MLVMAIVDGTRPASRRVWTGLQPTKCGMSGLRPTHSTFHRASRCHAGYEVAVMVPVDEFRVGADRCVRPWVSLRLRIPKPKGKPRYGQASRPARKDDRKLAGIPATANTNADERSATRQRQGEGARLRCDVGAGIRDAEVAAGGTFHRSKCTAIFIGNEIYICS